MQRTVLVTSGGLSLYSKYIKIGRKKGGFQPGGGILQEFLGGDVPLGPWNSQPIPELVQLNFATLY